MSVKRKIDTAHPEPAENATAKVRKGKSESLQTAQVPSGAETLKRLIRAYSYSKPEGFLPLGTSARFLLSLTPLTLLQVDHAIESITGLKANDFRSQPLLNLFSNMIVPEHARAFHRIMQTAVGLLNRYWKEALSINAEHNIKVKGCQPKRLLYQFRPVHWNGNGQPCLLHGHVTDFTPLQSGGPPRLSVIRNGKLVNLILPELEDILYGIDLPLNDRELSVLHLKQRGLRTKEIAEILTLKELTVYSIVRDIKRKTGRDILPLIHYLEGKGVLQTWSSSWVSRSKTVS